MGNTIPTDRRFDKPALESVVDLLNFSNKTYIKYGEIEVVGVLPIDSGDDLLYNSTIDIRLAGAEEGAPVARMTYGRLNIGDYVDEPLTFRYNGTVDFDTLLPQLKALHHIQIEIDDCTITIGELDSSNLRQITFHQKSDHMVWIGELFVLAAPDGHIALEIADHYLSGFTLPQLSLEAGGS